MKLLDPVALARSLFEESAEALILVDVREGRIGDANAAATRLCETNASTIASAHLNDFFQPISPRSDRHLAEMIRGDSKFSTDRFALHTAGGVEIPVTIHFRLMEGDIEHGLLTVRDNRFSAGAESLRENQERLTRIVEAVADGIFLVDHEQRITFANTAAERLSGWPRRKLTAICWHELRWQPDPEAPDAFDVRTIDQRVLEHNESIADVPVLLHCYDGQILHMSVNFVPLRDGHGAVTGMVVSFTDLSARAAAREQVRRQEERFRALVEKSTDGIALVNETALIQYLSPAIANILGFEPEEMEGKIGFSFVHPEDLPQVRISFDVALANPNETVHFRCRAGHKDGTFRHLDVSLCNRLGEPSVAAVVVNFRDVSERVRAEEALRESETRYRRLFDGNLAGVFRNSPDGRILQCNDAYAHIFGYGSAAEMRDLSVLLNYKSTADRESKIRLLRQTGRLSNHVSQSRHRDGSDIWILENTTLVVEPDGSEVFEGTVIDLTEQRRAAEQLARDHALLRALIQSIPDLIFFKDRAGRYLGCNRTFEEYSGVREEDIIGQTTADVFPIGEANLHQEEDQRVYASRQPVHLEKWLHHPTGRRLVEIVLTPLLGKDGGVLGLLGIGRDITDRQRAEEQVLQAAKMEAIGRLAGGIAHDFNNLLTIILGNLSLAKSKSSEALEELSDCEKAAQRAAELTNQLLGFARRSPLTPESIDLNRRVEETVGLLRRTIDPRITIELRSDADLWAIDADRAQIGQVLLNLCLNARDAMPDGGRLLIETANETLDDEWAREHLDARPGEFVRLTVSDTGNGIGPEVRARIFEPFFTTKPFGEGTGLGLAMVFGIVQQHGGWIECHSAQGEGTRFDAWFPRGDTQLEAATATGEMASGGCETILVVDDEPMIRDLARAILQQHGYSVVVADSGVAALDYYRTHRDAIDLVLLDLTMPELSGRDVLHELRRIDADVAVMFASGYSPDQLAEDEIRGVRGFIQKPYLPNDLARAIRIALERPTGA